MALYSRKITIARFQGNSYESRDSGNQLGNCNAAARVGFPTCARHCRTLCWAKALPTARVSSISEKVEPISSPLEGRSQRNPRQLGKLNLREMETESPASYRYMGRSFSDGGDSSGAFSDCNSDCSGEFTSSESTSSSSTGAAAAGGGGGGGGGGALHRLLISCAADYSDEVVRGLISELESPSATVESQRRAAMELRLLAKHSPENRLKIARAGAVRPLVALLSHPDPALQEHGVTAILNLSLRDENKDLIASAGAIKPLVRALKNGTPAARENAACALLRLSHAEEHRAAIGRSGAIPLLVALLESGGHRGKKDAATALYALCTTRENKIRAVQAGIARPLLDLMSDPESGMVDKAAYVLLTVAGLAEGRAAAVEEGGIPVLVELVEVGTPRQKEIGAAALLQICEDPAAYRTMVAREGAIPPLVALSQSGTTRAKQKAEALIELLRQPRSGTGGSRWRKPEVTEEAA